MVPFFILLTQVFVLMSPDQQQQGVWPDRLHIYNFKNIFTFCLFSFGKLLLPNLFNFCIFFSISQFCISVWFKTFIITKRPSKPVARNIKMRKQKCFNYKDLVTKHPGWALFDSYTFISQWKIQNWWDAISRGEEFSIFVIRFKHWTV